MKYFNIESEVIVIIFFILLIVSGSGCKKEKDPVKFSRGIFPDSLYNLININSKYDDYNSHLYYMGSTYPLIFSSNRGSNGSSFDFVQGSITFSFDQTNGNFAITGEITNDLYYGTIINKANSLGNDFGPYGFFSSNDGYEYLLFASETPDNSLDLLYVKNLPSYSTTAPLVSGPFPVKIFNTAFNDAYITFDTNGDSLYFCSDRLGDYDIYVHKRDTAGITDIFLGQDFEASEKADSINTIYNDKAPFVNKNIMFFCSDRLDGLGGYDIYYSVFKNGKWSSPFNPGPPINSSYDEFRPVIITHQDFSNQAIIFSSNRPGGKGGFDLYFIGFSLAASTTSN
ncbi:MAG: PD40 domain-containing protein [Bacteroidales bacterium]|nr:PD40 domain-containing protein [Bacteroidales bacterium]